jgi:hypothetical protein
MTFIVLLLDRIKPHHENVVAGANALTSWATNITEGAKLPEKKPGEAAGLALARQYKSFGEAMRALDSAVSVLLEEAWVKVKAGA